MAEAKQFETGSPLRRRTQARIHRASEALKQKLGLSGLARANAIFGRYCRNYSSIDGKVKVTSYCQCPVTIRGCGENYNEGWCQIAKLEKFISYPLSAKISHCCSSAMTRISCSWIIRPKVASVE